MSDKAIEVLLQERRSFPPPKALKKSAHVRSEQVFAKARKDPKGFGYSLMRDLTDLPCLTMSM